MPRSGKKVPHRPISKPLKDRRKDPPRGSPPIQPAPGKLSGLPLVVKLPELGEGLVSAGAPLSGDYDTFRSLSDAAADQTFQCILSEYNECRSEVSTYNSRVDHILLTYLSALFAFLGFLFGGDDPIGKASSLLNTLRTDEPAQNILIFVVFLQSFLALTVCGYLLSILRLSKHTSTYLRPRMAALIGRMDPQVARGLERKLFTSDITRTEELHFMLRVRDAVGFAWFGLMLTINFSVFVLINDNILEHSTATLFLIGFAILSNSVAVATTARQVILWMAFDAPTDDLTSKISRQLRRQGRVVFIAAFLVALLGMALAVSWDAIFNIPQQQ